MNLLKLAALGVDILGKPNNAVSSTTTYKVLSDFAVLLKRMDSNDYLDLAEHIILDLAAEELGREKILAFVEHLETELEAANQREARMQSIRNMHPQSIGNGIERELEPEPEPQKMEMDNGSDEAEPEKSSEENLHAGEEYIFWKLLSRHLRKEEGCVAKAYVGPLGKPHGGIGHQLIGDEINQYPVGTEIPYEIIDRWFAEDSRSAVAAVEQIIGGDAFWEELSDVRKVVLVSMCFQLGKAGLAKFKKFLAAVRDGQYNEAGREMQNSRWARQTPNRALRLANAMRINDAKELSD